jgi:hypothetical protein
MHDIHDKKYKPKPASISIDGFSRPRKRPDFSRGSIDFQKPSTSGVGRPTLDNFRRPEGYTANVNASLGGTISKAPPRLPTHNRRFFGRNRRKSESAQLDGVLHRRHRKISRRRKILRIFAVLLLILLIIGIII